MWDFIPCKKSSFLNKDLDLSIFYLKKINDINYIYPAKNKLLLWIMADYLLYQSS